MNDESFITPTSCLKKMFNPWNRSLRIFSNYHNLQKKITQKSTHRCARLTCNTWISCITTLANFLRYHCHSTDTFTTELFHQLISRDIVDIAWILVLQNIIDYHWLLLIIIYYHWLSLIIIDYLKIQEISITDWLT